MQDKPVGFGLLGAGLVAPFHAKSLRNSKKAKLLAVADFNRERAEALAREYECEAFDSLEQLLEFPGLDVVDVLTPNHLHFDAVAMSARAGKHVLVEKPPAMTLQDTDAMISLCEQAGVKFGVVLQCRVREAIQAIKNAVVEGRFGKILRADASMKWYRSEEYYLSDSWRSARASGAGVTVQHAFHYIDLLQYLVGPAEAVRAQMSNVAHPQVELEDTLDAFVDFKCGARGVVQASTGLWPGTDVRIEINGENGTAIMVGERMVTWQFKDERPEDRNCLQYGNEAVQTAATGPADFAYADHQVVIDDMADAIREDRPPVIPAASTRDTLELVLAMYKSADTQSRILLPLESGVEIDA